MTARVAQEIGGLLAQTIGKVFAARPLLSLAVGESEVAVHHAPLLTDRGAVASCSVQRRVHREVAGLGREHVDRAMKGPVLAISTGIADPVGARDDPQLTVSQDRWR